MSIRVNRIKGEEEEREKRGIQGEKEEKEEETLDFNLNDLSSFPFPSPSSFIVPSSHILKFSCVFILILLP